VTLLIADQTTAMAHLACLVLTSVIHNSTCSSCCPTKKIYYYTLLYKITFKKQTSHDSSWQL